MAGCDRCVGGRLLQRDAAADAADDPYPLGPRDQHLVGRGADAQPRPGQLRRGERRAQQRDQGTLNSATKALSLELASRRITVNAVAPGIIDSGMAQGTFDQAVIERLAPMKRIGRADEVAAQVAFLASDEAGYISGQSSRSTAG